MRFWKLLAACVIVCSSVAAEDLVIISQWPVLMAVLAATARLIGWGRRRSLRPIAIFEYEKGLTVAPLMILLMLGAAIQKLIDRSAAGWESASVVRQAQTTVYAGDRSLDVYAEDWLVYSMDGDIQIFRRRDLSLKIVIPITINTREQEFAPSLVRTHDGRYALLWARGTSKRNARRFVAFSADLLRWETPQRMVFEQPPGSISYTYAQAGLPERTYNVVPIRRGYAMLLAQGFVRYSEDLRNWGPPQEVIPQDLYRNRLVKTGDGTLWAVYENSSEELRPYTPAASAVPPAEERHLAIAVLDFEPATKDLGATA